MRSIDARRLSPARREFIFQRDGGQCAYCLEEANQVDHIMPWAFAHFDDVDNLVAACQLCNLIASDKIFDDFNAKRDYIQQKREALFRKRVVAIWTEDEVSKLGRKMKAIVRAGALIVDDRNGANELAERLVAWGFQVASKPV